MSANQFIKKFNVIEEAKENHENPQDCQPKGWLNTEDNTVNCYLAAMWHMSRQCHCPSKRGKSITDTDRNSFFVLIPTTSVPSGWKKASGPVSTLVSNLHKQCNLHLRMTDTTSAYLLTLTKQYALLHSSFSPVPYLQPICV